MKKTKRVIEIGVTIPFSKEDKLINQTYVDTVERCELGMMTFTSTMHGAHEDFWKNIRALHPELDSWEFIIDRKAKAIQVTRPKFMEL